MSGAGTGEQAAELRRAFDRTFASAPAPVVAHEDLLVLRLGSHDHVLRVAEISGLHPCPAVTPVPSALPELLGLGGLRGALVPVFDLRALLGLGAADGPRWVALLGDPVIGLAFEELARQLRVEASAIVTSTAPAPREFSRATLTGDGGARPVLDLPSLHAAIARRARATPVPKEKHR